jgi:stearoyl-CoA desaturase (delta-9 desaturase)
MSHAQIRRSFGVRLLRFLTNWFDSRAHEIPDPKPQAKYKAWDVDWWRTIPFVVMHLMCFAVIWVGWSPIAVAVAVGFYLVRMFAVTGFYHRYFSHRTFKTNRFWQFVFAVWGNSTVQRGPLWWAAHHRHHHKHSDRPEDLHSVKEHGLYWSHMGWILSPSNHWTNLKAVPDLAKYPELRWLDRYDTLLPLALGFGMYYFGVGLDHFWPTLGAGGFQMLIWGFFISTVFLFHATCTINSLSHLFGRQRFKTGDESKNNFWLSLLTLGEGWHNNHHHYPASTRQGFYWWEVDITYYGLKFLSWLRIIRDLNPVPERVLEAGRLEADLQ